MTLALLATAPSTPRLSPPRSPAQLLALQLNGIAAWHRHRRAQIPLQPGASREQRLDAARREEVIQRVQAALLAAAAADLSRADSPLAVIDRRALVVHRNAWFREKVGTGLSAAGLCVLASMDNGADALGTAIAEQPDLVVLEDSLPMMSALELLAHCRTMAPETRVVVQVSYEERVSDLMAAGAAAAYSRRVPPADVVAGVFAFVS